MSKDKITNKQWLQQGKDLFGEDFNNWKFKCPRCGNIASIKDFIELKKEASNSYSFCIKRFTEEKGCDYVSFGLINAGCIEVVSDDDSITHVFPFAEKTGE